jgi:hypothetical protein
VESYPPVVVGVAVVGDRKLRQLFNDGTAGDIDFSARIPDAYGIAAGSPPSQRFRGVSW